MLISFLDITKNFNMKISGILHVGAHKCEELKDYLTFGLTKSKIIWVEANKEKYDYMGWKYKDDYCFDCDVNKVENEEGICGKL